MPDLSKLEAPKDWDFGPNDQIGYLRECARHLETVIGPWLDDYDAYALYEILNVYSFQFEDGFGIGESEDGESGGYMDGNQAMLVASTFLEDPAKSYFDLKYHRGPENPPLDEEEVYRRKDALMARITADPRVRKLGRPYSPRFGPDGVTPNPFVL